MVEGISESLQAEVAPYGIRVIANQAGTILTPRWGKSPPTPEDIAYAAAPPLRHLVGDAEHLAALQANHGDAVIEAYFLDGEAFR